MLRRAYFIASLSLFLVISCILSITSFNEDTFEPTATPTPRANEQIPLAPTHTKTPKETNSEPALSEIGPWVLISGEDGLWAANPDGSGLTYIYAVQSEQLSIGGRFAAFIEETPGYYGSGLSLKIFSLPGGEVTILTNLLSQSTEPMSEGNADTEGTRAIYQALLTDNLAWSPDGTQLAFTSAHEGPSADLYIYSPEDGSLDRISTEPNQAFRPIWSPDGKKIIFIEATSFGTGAGYDLAGVWSVCADGSCSDTLYEPVGGDELALGWISEETLILYSFSAFRGYYNLRSFNIETGEINTLWNDPFAEAALDPKGGKALVVVDSFIARDNPGIEAGLYFVTANGEIEPISLVDFFSEDFQATVSWHEEASVFLVRLSNEFLSISPEGQIELIVPRIIQNPKPMPSPNGKLWVWLDDGNLVLNSPETQLQILFPSDSYPLWGLDNNSVLYVYGGQLHVGQLDNLNSSATGSNLIGGLRWIGP